MQEFIMQRPASPQEATAAASVRGSKYVAGGTDLLRLMKDNVESPIGLVDLEHVGLTGIDVDGSGPRLGAMARRSGEGACDLPLSLWWLRQQGKYPPPPVITAMAAQVVDRPVKLAVTSGQMFTSNGYRPCTIQNLWFAADTNGKLVAMRHAGLLADVDAATRQVCRTTQARDRDAVCVPERRRDPSTGGDAFGFTDLYAGTYPPVETSPWSPP
jgi:hypothetical protein